MDVVRVSALGVLRAVQQLRNAKELISVQDWKIFTEILNEPPFSANYKLEPFFCEKHQRYHRRAKFRKTGEFKRLSHRSLFWHLNVTGAFCEVCVFFGLVLMSARCKLKLKEKHVDEINALIDFYSDQHD